MAEVPSLPENSIFPPEYPISLPSSQSSLSFSRILIDLPTKAFHSFSDFMILSIPGLEIFDFGILRVESELNLGKDEPVGLGAFVRSRSRRRIHNRLYLNAPLVP